MKKFGEDYEKLIFLKELSEDFIFEVYSPAIMNIAETKFNPFDEQSKEIFYRLKIKSIELSTKMQVSKLSDDIRNLREDMM